MRLTFTGVDSHQIVRRIFDTQEAHRKVEFAVLVGSHSGDPAYPRFPHLNVVRHLANTVASPAIHFCGLYSRAINKGEFDDAIALASGYRRIQVNARTDDYNWVAISDFAAKVGREVIVQTRGQEFGGLLRGVSWLHDVSGGRGKDGVSMWPAPSIHRRCGFAGGLCYANIRAAFTFAQRYPGADIWFDMESGVRTKDRFDLNKVWGIADLVDRLERGVA